MVGARAAHLSLFQSPEHGLIAILLSPLFDSAMHRIATLCLLALLCWSSMELVSAGSHHHRHSHRSPTAQERRLQAENAKHEHLHAQARDAAQVGIENMEKAKSKEKRDDRTGETQRACDTAMSDPLKFGVSSCALFPFSSLLQSQCRSIARSLS
jgi:hypothetical protein